MKHEIAETFTPLEIETRTAVNTTTAAFHLNRRPQTLRSWACFENGPLRPVRINGRLAWPVRELRQLLGCTLFSKSSKALDGASENLHDSSHEDLPQRAPGCQSTVVKERN